MQPAAAATITTTRVNAIIDNNQENTNIENAVTTPTIFDFLKIL